MNGAHGAAEPGRPEVDVVVKKVRRSPRGEGEGGGGAPNGAPRAQPPGWEPLPSVDSLLEELLARAPAEPPGAGVSIETFTEELREIEAEMQNGGVGGAPATPTEPSEPPLSHEEEEAFASFAALPEGDAGTGRAPPRPPDPLAQVVASPPRAVGPPPSQPFTGGHGGTGRVPARCGALPDPPVSPGPFVSVLFGKLENMPHNSLYVNFLLTGLVAQLACYPQPLLRSFLLNTNMVFQPSVKSLLQVWPPGNPCPHGVMERVLILSNPKTTEFTLCCPTPAPCPRCHRHMAVAPSGSPLSCWDTLCSGEHPI